MKRLLLIIAGFVFTFQSFGWSITGHRTVGQIAEKHLTKKAKKRLELLFGQESLAMLCVWMDDVRSDSAYDYMTDWHFTTIENGQTYDQARKNPKGDIIMTLERVIATEESQTG